MSAHMVLLLFYYFYMAQTRTTAVTCGEKRCTQSGSDNASTAVCYLHKLIDLISLSYTDEEQVCGVVIPPEMADRKECK